jgi:prepilin-type N-terminal cleavage/methylation domain-containing protein
MKKFNSGFTLIEVLISMGILGVILLLINQVLASSLQLTALVGTQSVLQEELRTAGAIITDEALNAAYIFPPGTTFNISGQSRTVAGSGSPMVAMIVGPRYANMPCRKWSGDTAAPAYLPPEDIVRTGVAYRVGRSPNDGCYEFVAYYTVLRSTVADDANRNRLMKDDTNANEWVLMEYRKALNAKITSTPDINWQEVGCDQRFPGDDYASGLLQCAVAIAPNADPSVVNQSATYSIPAITKTADSSLVTRFNTRISDTVTWLNNNSGNSFILVDGISSDSGFSIAFPEANKDFSGQTDYRGVTELRIKLQGRVKNGGIGASEFIYPKTPIEYYVSPRNISPAKL